MNTSSSYCALSLETSKKWQQEHDDNETLVKKKRNLKGSAVYTEHGEGIVVGRDHPYRVIVKITKPNHQSQAMVGRFSNSELCYFPKEITVS